MSKKGRVWYGVTVAGVPTKVLVTAEGKLVWTSG